MLFYLFRKILRSRIGYVIQMSNHDIIYLKLTSYCISTITFLNLGRPLYMDTSLPYFSEYMYSVGKKNFHSNQMCG